VADRLDPSSPPIGFAHRGARAHAPENTIAAFELALRLGATGLESDVWVTADGEAVLDHDGVVRSGRRKRPNAQVPPRSLPTSPRWPSCTTAGSRPCRSRST
jgi:glycerophosphoryl diester phosphodiesterase